MWNWIFDSVGRWVALCVLVLALGVGIPIYLLWRASNVDSSGNYCSGKLIWKMPDEGACYRTCVLAATKSENPSWATRYCVSEACQGYTLVCRE